MLRAAPRVRQLLSARSQRVVSVGGRRCFADIKGPKSTGVPSAKPQSSSKDAPKSVADVLKGGKVQGATEIKRQPTTAAAAASTNAATNTGVKSTGSSATSSAPQQQGTSSAAPAASETKPADVTAPTATATPTPSPSSVVDAKDDRPLRVTYRHEQEREQSSGSGAPTAIIGGAVAVAVAGGYLYYKLRDEDFNVWFAKNVPLVGKSVAGAVSVPKKERKAPVTPGAAVATRDSLAVRTPPSTPTTTPAAATATATAASVTATQPKSDSADDETFAGTHLQPVDVDLTESAEESTWTAPSVVAALSEAVEATVAAGALDGPGWHAESGEGASDVAVDESSVEISTALDGPEIVAELEKLQGKTGVSATDAANGDDIYFRPEETSSPAETVSAAVGVLVNGAEHIVDDAVAKLDDVSLPIDAELSSTVAKAVVAGDAEALVGSALSATFPDSIADAHERIALLEYALDEWRHRDEERLARVALQQQEEDASRFKAVLEQQRSAVRVAFEKELDVLRDEFAEAIVRDRAVAESRYGVEMQKVLRRQAALQDSHMRERLTSQEKDLTAKLNAELQERLAEERAVRMQQLETLFGRLKALELVLSQEVNEGLIRGRAHQLWLAARALSYAARVGDPARMKAAVRALNAAGQDDEAVVVALANFPKEAFDRVIPSEDDLRRRFADVKRHAHRASLMPEEGGMVSHALSALLSALLFTPSGPVDGDDTDAILSRADDSLARGDLETAARHVNQLRGWPRKIATDWLKDARARLELAQAVSMVDAEVTLKATAMS